MKNSYNTINAPAQGIYKAKGSKFLSFAYPVTDEEEIRVILEGLRKEYHDARHHCFAWALGPERELYRANDDGEPTHSAGKPILGQIHAFGLTNILIVVVRYFGGTLLGVGGLVQAYREAAKDALNQATILTIFQQHIFKLEFDYKDTNLVMRILEQVQAKQIESIYTDRCFIKASVKLSEYHKVEAIMESHPEIIIKSEIDLKSY